MTVETIGPQKIDDPRGWLVFDWLPTDLQRGEDATAAADRHRGGDVIAYQPVHFAPPSEVVNTVDVFARPATDTERTLLTHLGYELPADLVTRVRWLSAGVRQRSWPQLENGQQA